MHFALPPRKNSQPPPYARSSRSLPTRRKQLQIAGVGIGGLLLVLYIISSLSRPSKEYIPNGTPEVVVVTLLDEPTMSENYRNKVMENRRYYTQQHGLSAAVILCKLGSDCFQDMLRFSQT